ncbi:MAG TPA: hypothetical protein VKZ81_25505 [Pseudonocardia sp.]|uniref:hypothetical protein n=1 Tax=Pseudonocardia sp. TaxID=60912 RepID=UPI002B4AC269|nr:hypothetical protein [Pseudonocardia sp.]HLU58832.1 hypothetical protein [Pseudonocardia sp.]
MLNPFHAIDVLAAEHRRELEADAAAHRLARTARPHAPRWRAWRGALRVAMLVRPARPVASDRCAARPAG